MAMKKGMGSQGNSRGNLSFPKMKDTMTVKDMRDGMSKNVGGDEHLGRGLESGMTRRLKQTGGKMRMSVKGGR